MSLLSDQIIKGFMQESPSVSTIEQKEMPVDIYDDNEKYVIIVDCPGVDKENLDVSLFEDHIIVRNTSEEEIDSDMNEILHERTYKPERIIELSEKIEIKDNSLVARHENGCLYISIMKAKEKEGVKVKIL